MSQTLKWSDILGLGFMTFAFFLGAGNIIFPPMAGFLSGENMVPAMFGFLITAVGLPLFTILAVAKANGGLLVMARHLPAKIALLMTIIVYLIVGPAFATPRTALVAYEVGIRPFIDAPEQWMLTLFTVVFFTVAMTLAFNQGKLLDAVGKVLTPLLIILLVVLALAVWIVPQGTTPMVTGAYVSHPFSTGFVEGYNTMDTFGSLMFGMLIIDLLKKRGIEQKTMLFKYLAGAGLIAAAGLVFVYLSLFSLGGSSLGVIATATNGGQIISAYVIALFGAPGQWILSGIVVLACLTTAVGLLSACSDFFHSIVPKISYRLWVLVFGIASALVANIGLDLLLKVSIPMLVLCYPVAISLVLLTFLEGKFANVHRTYRIVLCITVIFGLIDAVRSLSSVFKNVPSWTQLSWLDFLPLYHEGLAWVMPTLLAIFLCRLLIKPKQNVVAG